MSKGRTYTLHMDNGSQVTFQSAKITLTFLAEVDPVSGALNTDAAGNLIPTNKLASVTANKKDNGVSLEWVDAEFVRAITRDTSQESDET